VSPAYAFALVGDRTLVNLPRPTYDAIAATGFRRPTFLKAISQQLQALSRESSVKAASRSARSGGVPGTSGSLSLWFYPLGEHGGLALGEALLAIAPPLPIKEIRLEGTEITSTKITAAMRRGFSGAGLEVLRLMDCQLSEAAFVEMMGALPASLEQFSARGADCGDVGMAALASALPRMPRLKALWLQSCNTGGSLDVTVAGWSAFAKGLAHAPALQELDLSGSNLGDAGMAALAPALPSAAALQQVSFELCKLTEAGLQSLAEVLPQLPRLRGLSLFQNAIAQNGPGVAAVNDAVEDRAEAIGFFVAEYDWNHEALLNE